MDETPARPGNSVNSGAQCAGIGGSYEHAAGSRSGAAASARMSRVGGDTLRASRTGHRDALDLLTRKMAIAAGARKGVTISFRSERAENEMRDVNDRTYTPLVEIGAADVDFICAPSRISILAAAALEGLRRYSDEYEFGCLTGGQPRSRTPKFG